MKYLFVGAHMDDIELCCGGTLVKLVNQGHEVHTLVLSHIYNGLDLKEECFAALNKLSITRIDYHNFTTRYFYTERADILQLLINVRDRINPHYIFTHSINDIHQDHKVVGEESVRAFKRNGFITYIGEWNTRINESNYYIELTDEEMSIKYAAMNCYQSQQHRIPYFEKPFTYSRALLSGAKIGVKYAEAFNIVNMRG